MDELQAKKILDALAKKMGCDSFCIYSSYDLIGTPSYLLMFVKNGFKFSVFVKSITYNSSNEYELWHEFQFDDASFCNILKKLEKHKIYVNVNSMLIERQYSIHNIEQLMIDLELEGYL